MKYQESANVELKRELVDDVKKQIVAFLNTEGGTIYIGVEDDGTVKPINSNEERDIIDTKIGNWISESIVPIPSGLVTHAFNDDGVMEIRIKDGNHKPYYLREKGPKPSGVYKRVGRSIRMVNDDEILQMIMLTKNYVYEADVSDEQELSFKYLNMELTDNGYQTGTRVLTSLGIMNKDGKYTNLGYLLSDQSGIAVKYAEYDKDLNFIVKKTFTGSLLKVLRDVEEQTEKQNTVSAVIDGKSFRRKETHSFPGASLREIILNAFCHCDYFIRSNIKIEFFPDKLKVTSPGGIFNATLNDIMNGIQTYRNPRLVNVFDKLKYIENFGTGIPRTMAAYKGTGFSPLFEASNNFFIVTLPNLNGQNADQINDQINDQISDLGLDILRLIKSNPGIKVPEMYKKLSVADDKITLDKIRNELKRELKPYVKFVGSKKTGGYYLAGIN